jgi:hypothetical protein
MRKVPALPRICRFSILAFVALVAGLIALQASVSPWQARIFDQPMK